MNYKIVQDEDELQKFINWLPDLQDGQKFYYCLMARKKYAKTDGLKSDKSILKRGTSDKERLISKLRKLEVEMGSYEMDGVSVNQESLALYITPNPRDMHKAGLKTINELTKFLIDGRVIYNPQSVALNMIQVTGVKKYFDVDIDCTEKIGMTTLLNWLTNQINFEAFWDSIIRTRGGFHVLIDLEKISPEYKKTWYNNMTHNKSEFFTVTMNSDGLTPCPGCVQSDFVPKLC